MTNNIVKALNEQINFEFESAYLYLAMSIGMKEAKYPGFGAWLDKQYKEELEHAHKLIAFVEDCDENVVLENIAIPTGSYTDPVVVAKAVLAHEQHVTKRIHAICGLAFDEKDYATHNLLSWFVTEQVEEEANARNIIDMFTFAGDNRASQMLVDSKLGARQ